MWDRLHRTNVSNHGGKNKRLRSNCRRYQTQDLLGRSDHQAEGDEGLHRPGRRRYIFLSTSPTRQSGSYTAWPRDLALTVLSVGRAVTAGHAGTDDNRLLARSHRLQWAPVYRFTLAAQVSSHFTFIYTRKQNTIFILWEIISTVHLTQSRFISDLCSETKGNLQHKTTAVTQFVTECCHRWEQ